MTPEALEDVKWYVAEWAKVVSNKSIADLAKHEERKIDVASNLAVMAANQCGLEIKPETRNAIWGLIIMGAFLHEYGILDFNIERMVG